MKLKVSSKKNIFYISYRPGTTLGGKDIIVNKVDKKYLPDGSSYFSEGLQ